jgi:hypothetical protein
MGGVVRLGAATVLKTILKEGELKIEGKPKYGNRWSG